MSPSEALYIALIRMPLMMQTLWDPPVAILDNEGWKGMEFRGIEPTRARVRVGWTSQTLCGVELAVSTPWEGGAKG